MSGCSTCTLPVRVQWVWGEWCCSQWGTILYSFCINNLLFEIELYRIERTLNECTVMRWDENVKLWIWGARRGAAPSRRECTQFGKRALEFPLGRVWTFARKLLRRRLFTRGNYYWEVAECRTSPHFASSSHTTAQHCNASYITVLFCTVCTVQQWSALCPHCTTGRLTVQHTLKRSRDRSNSNECKMKWSEVRRDGDKSAKNRCFEKWAIRFDYVPRGAEQCTVPSPTQYCMFDQITFLVFL